MPASNLRVVGGSSDHDKKRAVIDDMLNRLKEVGLSISNAHSALEKLSVDARAIKDAFQELTRAQDILWNLRDNMDSAGIGYLILSHLNDLLSDMETSYSIPYIQLTLRILIQSKKQLNSDEALKQIVVAANGLRQLQSELNSLERDLMKEM